MYLNEIQVFSIADTARKDLWPNPHEIEVQGLGRLHSFYISKLSF